MARRPRVPQFGNWDANDHMPYTVVFDKARNGRGNPVNPNDPTDNPDLSDGSGSRHNGGTRMYNVNDPEDVDASDMHRDRPGFGGGGGGRDAGNFRGQPPRSVVDAQGRRPGAPEGRGNPVPPSRAPPQADFTRRPGNRDSLGDRNLTDSPSTSFSADQSPAHPGGNPVKKSAVGGVSPAWEPARRNSKGEEAPSFAPATPTRGRGRPGNSKPEESAQKGPAALPKFGTWNVQDPSSGDGFTVIFNNARNERKAGGPGRIPQPGDQQQEQDLYGNHDHGHKSRDGNKKWFCCFGRV